MAKTKKSTKSEKPAYKCGDVFLSCFITGVITAAVVALTFSVGFSLAYNYEAKHHYGFTFKNQFAKELADAKDGYMLEIGAGALIDLFESKQTGFVYISADDCENCVDFEEKLVAFAANRGALVNVYHYNYPSNDPSVYDDYANLISRDQEEAPVLLYVRDGRIYDRLDEANDNVGIDSFIAKYK